MLTAFLMILSSFYLSSPAEAGATDNLREIKRIQFGGEGGWDYLTADSEEHRLYIARVNRVMVIDTDSAKLIGEVQGLNGAHGVALAKGLGLGFATSGKSGEVVVFNLKTLQVTDKIHVGENPDAIVYEPASNRVLAFNGKSKSMSAIDPLTRKVMGSLALPGKPEFAVAGQNNQVFVNIEDKNELLSIDAVQLKVAATYSLEPCDEPTGLSIDPKSKRLIVGCGNKLAVIVDADSGKVLQKFAVGEGVDATAFDAGRGLALISASEGLLSVLAEDASGFRSAQSIATVRGARTLAVDSKTGRVFLPFAQFGSPLPGQKHPSVLPDTFGLLILGRQ